MCYFTLFDYTSSYVQIHLYMPFPLSKQKSNQKKTLKLDCIVQNVEDILPNTSLSKLIENVDPE